MSRIDYNKLNVTLFSYKDNFSECDFKEQDGSDPLGVDDFVRNRAIAYKENNLCVIYVVKHEHETVGFFTLSMGALEVKALKEVDKIEVVSQLPRYPALLLGNMGVDKKFRGKRIGKWICQYCIGFTLELSTKIGCGYIFLQSNENKRGFYEKLDFVTSGKMNGHRRMWMYRRIFTKTIYRQIFEFTPASDKLSLTKVPEEKYTSKSSK